MASSSSSRNPQESRRTASSAIDRDGDGDIDRDDLAGSRTTTTTTRERSRVDTAPALAYGDENDGTRRDWTNKPSLRDIGLLLWRLFALVMLLHGWHKLMGYSGFQASVARNPYGAMAPGLFALLVVAGQLLLPLAVAAGFMTRIAAALQSFMMFMIWLLWSVLGPRSASNPGGLFARTGGINNEAAFIWALFLLPLVFVGAGRLSVDQLLGAKRGHKRTDERV